MERPNEVARLEQFDGIPLVYVEGEVDLSNSKELDEVLRSAAQCDAGAVVVSLENTRYFDSAAIHVLIRNRARMATGRQAFLIIEPRLAAGKRVLEIAGLLHGEAVFTGPDEALSEAKRLRSERRPD